MGIARMINPTMPELADPKDQEEVRKALLNISSQLNAELDEIRAQIKALTP
jgi:hypothetical protein